MRKLKFLYFRLWEWLLKSPDSIGNTENMASAFLVVVTAKLYRGSYYDIFINLS